MCASAGQWQACFRDSLFSRWADALVDIRKAHPNGGCASFTVNRFHMQCDYRPEAKDNNSTQSARLRFQRQNRRRQEEYVCALVEPAVMFYEGHQQQAVATHWNCAPMAGKCKG